MSGGAVGTGRLGTAIFAFYALFVFSSTFSRALSQMALGVALALFLVVIIRTGYNPFTRTVRPFYVFFGLYLGWLLLSAILSRAPAASLYYTRREWLIAAVPIGVYVMQSEVNRRRLVWSLAVGVALLSLYAVLEYVTGWDWLNVANGLFTAERVTTVAGTFIRPNTFAGFFSVAAIFITAYAVYPQGKLSREQIVLAAIGLLGMVAVLVSFRRGPIVSLIICLAFLALRKKQRIRWLMFGLAAFLVLVAFTVPSLRDRFALPIPTEESADYRGSRPFIWEQSLKMIVENPVLGVGNGNFGDAYGEIVRRDYGSDFPWWWVHGQAHNDVINLAAVGGVPCAVLFGAIWVFLLRQFFRGVSRVAEGEEGNRALFGAFFGSILFLMTAMTVSSFADLETHALIMFIWAFGLAPGYNQQTGERICRTT